MISTQIPPENELESKFKLASLDKLQIVEGSKPCSDVNRIDKLLNRLNCPMEVGRGPVSLELPKDKYESRDKSPMEVGIVPGKDKYRRRHIYTFPSNITQIRRQHRPENELESKSMLVSFVKLPIVDGSDPCSEVDEIVKELNMLNCPMDVGRGPVNLQ